jgi:hypothetical protein
VCAYVVCELHDRNNDRNSNTPVARWAGHRNRKYRETRRERERERERGGGGEEGGSRGSIGGGNMPQLKNKRYEGVVERDTRSRRKGVTFENSHVLPPCIKLVEPALKLALTYFLEKLRP